MNTEFHECWPVNRRPWTPEELAQLTREYPRHPTVDLAHRLGRTVSSVYAKAAQLGVKKAPDFDLAARVARLLKFGRVTRFTPGQVPPNKGMRRPGWAPGRMAETQFKPGRPATEARNYRPIGSYRISRDGYLERKMNDDLNVAPVRRWERVHRLVWEAAHGPVPDGYVVVFKPGKRTTVLEEITPDILEIVTRQELIRRNSVVRYPPEVRQAAQTLGRLRAAIRRKEKNA